MLQFVGNTKGRLFIAVIFLQMMLVIVLPSSWLHCHSHGKPYETVQRDHAKDARGIDLPTVNAEDDHCTLCNHAWPGFIAADQLAVSFSPSFEEASTLLKSQCVSHDLEACMDGRGPPFLA